MIGDGAFHRAREGVTIAIVEMLTGKLQVGTSTAVEKKDFFQHLCWITPDPMVAQLV